MHIQNLDWNLHTHIGLDLDETLASTVAGMLEVAHEQKKLLHIQIIEDIHSYSFQDLDSGITEEEGNHIWESFGKKTMDPLSVERVDGARAGFELLQSLRKRISLITARSDHEEWKVTRTKNWMRTHFPEVREEDIFFVNHFSDEARPKSHVCREKGISLMIDDSYDNALDLIENDIVVVLLERPWNRSKTLEHPLLYRAKNWQEIIISLKKYVP